MTATADRPLEIETSSPGATRTRRIESALADARIAYRENNRTRGLSDLAFIEAQVTAAEGAIAPDLMTRVEALRVALGVKAPVTEAPLARVIPMVAPGKVTAQTVVAGARAEGSGILVGWWGSGELSRARIVEALGSANLPREWAPASRSAHAQAGHAVSSIDQNGRIVRAERNSAKRGLVRGWRARWVVGVGRTSADVGEKFGEVVLTATLIGDELQVESSDDVLKARVEAEFARRVGDEMYAGHDVTAWIVNLLRTRFGAVKLGGNWYIPRQHIDECTRLLGEVAATGWGRDWIGSYQFPALPVSTTKQLQRGLGSSLIAEVNEIMGELDAARAEARKEKKADISPRAAAGFVGRLTEIRPRAKALADVLGDVVADVATAIDAALAIVEPLADDASTRGSLVWSEITDR